MHEDSFSKKAIALTMELGGVPSTNSGGWSVNRHRFFLRERRLYRSSAVSKVNDPRFEKLVAVPAPKTAGK